MPGEEWIVVPVNFHLSFCGIKLDRACVKKNPVPLILKVQILSSDNSTEKGIIISMDQLAVHNLCSAWAFTALSGREMIKVYGAFAVTTSNMTMETMTVMKAIERMKI